MYIDTIVRCRVRACALVSARMYYCVRSCVRCLSYPLTHSHIPPQHHSFTLPDNPHDRFDFTLSDDLVRASQKLMAFESEPFGDKRVPVSERVSE